MNCKDIKIDILLPYWGEFKLLKKAVESVLAQTYSNWNLYIFDDAYPSGEASKYFKTIKDKRVKYFRHKRNIGITANFNFALNQTRADFFIMIGCDDIMLPNYLEVAVQNIQDADFYQPMVDVIDADGNVYSPLGDRIKRLLRPNKSGIYHGERLATSLCHGNWLYFPSILWRTKAVKKHGFDNRYKIVEDVALQLSIIKDGGKLFLDNETTFQYRRFPESLSSKEKSKNGIRFAEESEIYNKFASEFKRIGWMHASRAARYHITSRINRLIS